MPENLNFRPASGFVSIRKSPLSHISCNVFLINIVADRFLSFRNVLLRAPYLVK